MPWNFKKLSNNVLRVISSCIPFREPWKVSFGKGQMCGLHSIENPKANNISLLVFIPQDELKSYKNEGCLGFCILLPERGLNVPFTFSQVASSVVRIRLGDWERGSRPLSPPNDPFHRGENWDQGQGMSSQRTMCWPDNWQSLSGQHLHFKKLEENKSASDSARPSDIWEPLWRRPELFLEALNPSLWSFLEW